MSEQSSGGTKYDQDKLRYDLIPPFALEQLARVYTHGARKYSDNNWRKGMKWSRLYGALMRHIEAWRRGEDYDEESGCLHLASVAWCAITLMEYRGCYPAGDDRTELFGGDMFLKHIHAMCKFEDAG